MGFLPFFRFEDFVEAQTFRQSLVLHDDENLQRSEAPEPKRKKIVGKMGVLKSDAGEGFAKKIASQQETSFFVGGLEGLGGFQDGPRNYGILSLDFFFGCRSEAVWRL